MSMTSLALGPPNLQPLEASRIKGNRIDYEFTRLPQFTFSLVAARWPIFIINLFSVPIPNSETAQSKIQTLDQGGCGFLMSLN